MTDTTTTAPVEILTAKLYAEHVGISMRVLLRRLKAEEIPGARKDAESGEWRIPADAKHEPRTTEERLALEVAKRMRAEIDRPASALVPLGLVPQAPAIAAPAPTSTTVDEFIASLPAFVPVKVAADERCLNVSVSDIMRDPEFYQVRQNGKRHEYQVPRARIKEIRG